MLHYEKCSHQAAHCANHQNMFTLNMIETLSSWLDQWTQLVWWMVKSVPVFYSLKISLTFRNKILKKFNTTMNLNERRHPSLVRRHFKHWYHPVSPSPIIGSPSRKFGIVERESRNRKRRNHWKIMLIKAYPPCGRCLILRRISNVNCTVYEDAQVFF